MIVATLPLSFPSFVRSIFCHALRYATLHFAILAPFVPFTVAFLPFPFYRFTTFILVLHHVLPRSIRYHVYRCHAVLPCRCVAIVLSLPYTVLRYRTAPRTYVIVPTFVRYRCVTTLLHAGWLNLLPRTVRLRCRFESTAPLPLPLSTTVTTFTFIIFPFTILLVTFTLRFAFCLLPLYVHTVATVGYGYVTLRLRCWLVCVLRSFTLCVAFCILHVWLLYVALLRLPVTLHGFCYVARLPLRGWLRCVTLDAFPTALPCGCLLPHYVVRSFVLLRGFTFVGCILLPRLRSRGYVRCVAVHFTFVATCHRFAVTRYVGCVATFAFSPRSGCTVAVDLRCFTLRFTFVGLPFTLYTYPG